MKSAAGTVNEKTRQGGFLSGLCQLPFWCPEEDSNLHSVATART